MDSQGFRIWHAINMDANTKWLHVPTKATIDGPKPEYPPGPRWTAHMQTQKKRYGK